MSTTTIPILPVAISLDGSEQMEVVQAGTSKRITLSQVFTYGGVVPVASGGTGAASMAANYLTKGNGTSPYTASLVYDNGTGVAIGSSPPYTAKKLTVYDMGTTDPAQGLMAGIAIINSDTTTAALSGLTAAATDSLGSVRHGSAIAFGKDGTWTGGSNIYPGFISFWTRPNSTANEAERMRIDSAGNVGIGTTANASAALDVQSTTKGVRLPNMTTTQKNAIAAPAAGLLVFDTTLGKMCVYTGAAWQTVTST